MKTGLSGIIPSVPYENFTRHVSADIRYLFLENTLRQDLASSASLHSPSDPRAKRTNDQDVKDGIFNGWGRSWWKSAQVHQRGISYAVHKSGDDAKGSGSITMLTRNLEGVKAHNRVPNLMNNWSHNWDPAHRAIRPTETWAGPSDDKRVVMSGMDQGQGQIAFADGQVQQSDDAGLQEAMRQNAELVGGKADSRPQEKTNKSRAEVGGRTTPTEHQIQAPHLGRFFYKNACVSHTANRNVTKNHKSSENCRQKLCIN